MDKLKDISRQLGGIIKKQQLYSCNLDETSSRELVIKNYNGHRISINEYPRFFEIVVKIDSDFSFSINRPDDTFLYRIPRNLPNAPFTVYVSEGGQDSLTDNRLASFWSSLTTLYKTNILAADDSIFLYINAIQFAIHREKDLVSALDNVVAFIDGNEIFSNMHDELSIPVGNIPEPLRPLAPLLKKYAIPDDSERAQAIEDLGENEKARLIKAVEPLFGEINSYLDSFKNQPLSEEASLIGNLAELVSELKLGSD